MSKSRSKLLTVAFIALVTLGPTGLAQSHCPPGTSIALSFDGGEHADCGDLPATRIHTIEAWVRFPIAAASTAQSGKIAGQTLTPFCGLGMVLWGRKSSAGTEHFFYNLDHATCGGAGGLLSVSRESLGQWHHLSGTYDGQWMRFYVDGELERELQISWAATTTGFHIGAQREGGSSWHRHFNGDIKDVRFWSYARSGAEIKSSFTASLSGTEPGLLAYWKLDEGAGQVIHDSSPNGFDGFLGLNSSSSGDPADPDWSSSPPCVKLPLLTGGQTSDLDVRFATPSGSVLFGYSSQGSGPEVVSVGGCGGISALLTSPVHLGAAVVGAGGEAQLTTAVPASAAGVQLWIQALDVASCTLSNAATVVVG